MSSETPKPEMHKPEHETFVVDHRVGIARGYFVIENENTAHECFKFEDLVLDLLTIFESQYGSRRTYSLDFTEPAKYILCDKKIISLEKIVALQNKVAQARSILEG